jgi:hypothetical protein
VSTTVSVNWTASNPGIGLNSITLQLSANSSTTALTGSSRVYQDILSSSATSNTNFASLSNICIVRLNPATPYTVAVNIDSTVNKDYTISYNTSLFRLF